MKESCTPGLRFVLALTVSAGALVLLAYGSLLGLGMLGWDGWPLVLAGTIDGPGDLFGTFGEELMNGRYPFGSFYRPLVHLSFGIDHALWGLDPWGYHLTDQLWLVANTVLLGCLAARLAPRRKILAAAIAATLFALHPVQLELLPVAPRRADAMALAFLLATLHSLPGGRPTAARGLLLALLGFCACASKETGVIVAPLAIVAARWVDDLGSGAEETWSGALSRSAPVLAGVAIYAVARTAVLGGIGGHAGTPMAETGILERWNDLVQGALVPRSLPGLGSTAAVLLSGLALVGGGLAATPDRRTRALVVAFMIAVLAITGLADRSHEWYAMLFTVPLTLLAGTAVAARGGVTLGLVLLVGGTWIRATPLIHSPTRLLAAGAQAESLVSSLEQQLGQAAAGSTATIDPWIPMLQPMPDGVSALHVAYDYTVAAFVEARWPGNQVSVSIGPPLGGGGQIPGAVHIRLVPPRMP